MGGGRNGERANKNIVYESQYSRGKTAPALLPHAITDTHMLQKYYSTVKRHAQAVTVLEECGLLALPVEDEEETS